ncbi:MAG: hypothetical protein LBU99_04070 [Spirochaetaceae bacterium]|jgi:hypothetical protein|nr:hypothetical protein [Spirochaetaceae bacterium]
MPQTMTLDEKLTVSNKAIALKRAGDREGYERLMKTIPLPPYHAQFLKEKVGVDYLTNSDWNLSEAEAAFGVDWLNRKY